MALDVGCEVVRLLADAFYHKALPPDIMQAITDHISVCPKNCGFHVRQYAADFGDRWIQVFGDEENTG